MKASRKVLIVEDEPLIAMMLEDVVDTLGHEVAATCDTLATALAAVAAGGFDIAILDVHLGGGQSSWPVADQLADRGIPFVVATGGHVEPPPARHAGAPQLAKPFTMDSVAQILESTAIA